MPRCRSVVCELYVLCSFPESLGRIFKVQLWHNNAGPSPSWYLSRVVVRDACTGLYSVECSLSIDSAHSADRCVLDQLMRMRGAVAFVCLSVCLSIKTVCITVLMEVNKIYWCFPLVKKFSFWISTSSTVKTAKYDKAILFLFDIELYLKFNIWFAFLCY